MTIMFGIIVAGDANSMTDKINYRKKFLIKKINFVSMHCHRSKNEGLGLPHCRKCGFLYPCYFIAATNQIAGLLSDNNHPLPTLPLL